MLRNRCLSRRKRIEKLKRVVFSLMIITEVNIKKPRRWWTRPWFDKTKGNLSLVSNDFVNTDPEQFKIFLRMDKPAFDKLLNAVTPILKKKDTFMRQSISVKDKLIITLRFLATGETYRSLMYSFRIAESTISLFVPEVCKAIYNVLKEDYLKVPNSAADWLNIAKDFEKRWNFPNIIGALDGKHIVFNAPKSAGSAFFNYKNANSIVLLALVDANYNFIYIDVGTNGRVSDGGVFVNTSLYEALFSSGNYLNLPEDNVLPGRNTQVPYLIVADAAFPLSDKILKPFPFRNMTTQQRIFNYRLSRARRVVENAFGILANRFRVLLTTINLNPEKVQGITLACCVLHNYLKKECPTFTMDNEDIDDNDYVFEFALSKQGGNRSSIAAGKIREEFMEYVNNEGAVSWQNNIN